MNGLHHQGRTRLAMLLRHHRYLQNATTRDLAKEIGISHPTLNRIERGHAMDVPTLMKILNWLLQHDT